MGSDYFLGWLLGAVIETVIRGHMTERKLELPCNIAAPYDTTIPTTETHVVLPAVAKLKMSVLCVEMKTHVGARNLKDFSRENAFLPQYGSLTWRLRYWKLW